MASLLRQQLQLTASTRSVTKAAVPLLRAGLPVPLTVCTPLVACDNGWPVQQFTAMRRSSITRTAMLDAPATSSFASMMDSEEDEGEQEVVEVDASLQDDSLKVENLGLSSETVAALRTKGINSLFPIQKSVYQPIVEGRDIIGRAKTGSGKTLAFALPVIENLLEEDRASGQKPRRGRTPRAIVLAPTRELANQVAREFESVCPKLSVACVYGGTSIGNNFRDLERGADVVVGTPGRVIDLIEREALKLDAVRYAILDEADQMLDMGFQEDMENILSYVPTQRQTLLFSATLPAWVNKVAKKFQNNPLKVDLVGEQNTGRLADTIRLLVMQVEWSQKINALLDAITLHAAAGKTIVFVNQKMRADEVCEAVGGIHPTVVLHGDISQGMRDRSLQQFRDGKVNVLVATDVAARGLDIPSVDLVVHYDVPLDNESFLHRSGRTGRAGNKGTAVILFTEKEAREVGRILVQTKVDNAELVGAPEPKEVLGKAARNVMGQLDKVDSGVIEFFVPAAEKLLTSDQPLRVMAAALAALSGFRSVPQPRSLLTYEEGVVTLRLMGPGGAGGIDGFRSLVMAIKAVLTKAKVSLDFERGLGKVQVVNDRQNRMSGACFDVPMEVATALVSNEKVVTAALKMGYQLDQPKTLPLDPQEMKGDGPSGGSYGRFGRSRGGDDRRGSGGRFASGRSDRGERGSWGGSRDGGRDGGRFSDGGRSRDGASWKSGRGGRGEERNGRGGSSRSSSFSSDEFFDPAGGSDYWSGGRGGSGNGSGNGGAPARGGRSGGFKSAPSKDGWAQW